MVVPGPYVGSKEARICSLDLGPERMLVFCVIEPAPLERTPILVHFLSKSKILQVIFDSLRNPDYTGLLWTI